MIHRPYTLSTVTTTDPITLCADNRITFGIHGSGTVIAQVKLTAEGQWFDVQTCVDSVLYSSITGANFFRFNQTVASGDTICEVSTGR